MTSKRQNGICSKCDREGFRYRGDRWLCVIHQRFDTMRMCAHQRGKRVPTEAELWVLAKPIMANDLKCPNCQQQMQWAGERGEMHTVTLQHDRSGELRLICFLCNQRHNDMPGDTFYELPPDHWYCARCKTVKPLAEFYKNRAGSCCKVCRKKFNREMWAKFGKQWMANSQAKKARAK